METSNRNGFVSKTGFILASAGSAIGLGNLWSFPYKTSANGGAAFVLVYLLSVILIGSIIFIAETHIGKRSQANVVTAFKKINKSLGWLGLICIIVCLLILSFYSILGGYTVKYTLNSFNDNFKILTSFSGNIGEVIIYTAIFLAISVAIVSTGVAKGIEKVSKILMPALFIILIGIVIYCLCLGEGVMDGLIYFLNPDFSTLGLKGMLAAMSQALFSISLGMGVTISLGSYAGKDIDIGKSVIMVTIFDTLVALLAGLAIFPAIYHHKAVTGESLADNGILLLFASMPIIFNGLGAGGKFVSFLFFGMVSIAAITSIISLIEVITQFFIQTFKMKRKTATFIVGAITFLISIPVGISLGFDLNGKAGMSIFGLNYFEFFDALTSTVFIPTCALGSCLALGWFMFDLRGKNRFSIPLFSENLAKDDLKLKKGKTFFVVMVKYVTPILIGIIEVFGLVDTIFKIVGNDRQFSLDGLGIVLVSLAILALLIAIYFIFFKNRDTGCNADEIYRQDKKLK